MLTNALRCGNAVHRFFQPAPVRQEWPCVAPVFRTSLLPPPQGYGDPITPDNDRRQKPPLHHGREGARG